MPELEGRPQEVVIIFGGPGSGKSTFVTSKMSTYLRVNNDELKTKEKCMKLCHEGLDQGKSVVIDNTNSTKEQRDRYISIAKAKSVPVRCFVMAADKETCMHNNF